MLALASPQNEIGMSNKLSIPRNQTELTLLKKAIHIFISAKKQKQNPEMVLSTREDKEAKTHYYI